MKNKLLQIIKHYGVANQLKYIHSEYYELDEAIILGEQNSFSGMYDGIPNYYQEHIAEELADVMVMLKQFQYYYDIEDKKIKDIMQFKIARQLERISEEHE